MHDPEAILEQLLAHEAWVRGLARHLVADRHEADEVAQDTWVAALANPPSQPGAIRSWLRRTARNFVAERRQADSNRRAREHTAAKREGTPSVEDLRAQEQTRHRVAMAVFSLEEPYRTAVIQRYFENLPPREIAKRLEVTAAAVETRLRRGLGQLRARLDRDFGGRKSWCAALLPLSGLTAAEAAATVSTSSTAATVGALVMGTKVKIGLVVIAAAATAIVFWTRGDEEKRPEVERTEVGHEVERRAELETGGATQSVAPATEDRPAANAATASAAIVPVVPPVDWKSLTGTVRSETGEPIANALLEVGTCFPAHPIALKHFPVQRTTRSDSGGRFEFERLHPDLYLSLGVSAKGFGRESTEVRPGDRLDFALAVAGRIAGRVLDRGTGEPIPGAVVGASLQAGRGGNQGSSDAAGRFVIDDLRPGVYRVGVESSAHKPDADQSVHLTVTSRQVTDVEFRLDRGMTLRGRVLDSSGRPIVAARVAARIRVVTDPVGRFVLRGLNTSTSIQIEADKKVPCSERVRFTRTELETGSAERTFELSEAAILRGRVVGPDGRPIAGAGIRTRDNRPPIRADDEGRFEISFDTPGRWPRFAVLADGYAPAWLDPVKLAPGETRDDLVVRLSRGGAIEGRVVTPEGAPIAGHTLLLRTWPWLSRELATIYRLTTTAADGRFRLEGLSAGAYEVSANGKNLPDIDFVTRGRVREIPVEEGRTTGGILLIPARRISLSGRVVDEQGRPVAGVRVSTASGPSRTRSDPDGRFTFDRLPEGCPFGMAVHAHGYRFLQRESNLPATVTADAPELVVRVARIPSGIRGFVVRADTGTPVTDFWVRVHRVEKRAGGRTRLRSLGPSRPYHFRSVDGRFRVATINRGGEYALDAGTDSGLVSAEPARTLVSSDAAPAVVQIRLVPSVTVRGRVLAPDGTPVDRASVRAYHPSDGRQLGKRSSSTAADGEYVIENIPPGEVELWARHRSWIAARVVVHAESKRNTRRDLRLGEKSAVLALMVTDTAGKPVVGARMRLFTPAGEPVGADLDKYFAHFRDQGRPLRTSDDLWKAIGRTGADGRIERRFLPPGDYRLEVDREGYESTRHEVSVRLDSTDVVLIALKPKR